MQKASKSGREKVGLTTVEVFLQMCCLSTSIFERPRLLLCLQHAPITKPIYTQNSEEPDNHAGLGGGVTFPGGFICSVAATAVVAAVAGSTVTDIVDEFAVAGIFRKERLLAPADHDIAIL